jgi:hypothetical protein
MPKNESYFDPLIFAGICIGIPVFIFQIGEMSYFVAIYTGFVFGLVLRLFVSSVIFHILWKAVGGTASFKNTFQIVAYSSALVLFTAIPIDLLSLIISIRCICGQEEGSLFITSVREGRQLLQ